MDFPNKNVTQRMKLLNKIMSNCKEMVPTGTVFFYGEGEDEDWLVLLDPWCPFSMEQVLDTMDKYAELGGSGPQEADPTNIGDGWRSYKTDKLAGDGGAQRAINFIFCVDKEFYEKMKRATDYVKKSIDGGPQGAAHYREKANRVSTFRSIVGR
ncbi:hypothetical protein JG068_015 [Burkholderia phage JG068]|uniref:Uncharacterized protein n=1 Tax=Burkholderia phage JG068 TaxID=1401297 RepID=U3PB97_9CAUD|nr:hypothetical protein JG068_015 [Burkholderia phage JG068]AGW43597.1 hypothetical protein JG068_015 [Burkholderia phage JG068]